MEKYLDCFKPLKNTDSPQYTPLSFHKCYQDALVFLCSVGLPKNNDFSGYKKVKVIITYMTLIEYGVENVLILQADYNKLKPFCYFNNRKLMPGCCNKLPLPWTVTEILEATRNETAYNKCMDEMGDDV